MKEKEKDFVNGPVTAAKSHLEWQIFDWNQPNADLNEDYHIYVDENYDNDQALMERDFLALEGHLYKLDLL